MPSLVDELPLIALAAARARGRTVVRGAEELALKESNRIATMARRCRRRRPRRGDRDGWRSAACRRASAAARSQPHGDHRIAMIGGDRRAVLGERRPRRRPRARIDVSFPGFREILVALEVAVAERE